jgi:hypothetical protein
MLKDLTTPLLARSCRIFFALAYPEGEAAVPLSRRAYLHLRPDQPLEPLLRPPVCQTLRTPDGAVRGYAFRLGSAAYPHLKLQVVRCDEEAPCVFGVDTHDAMHLDPDHPDAARWAELQLANRALKERIERAWEAAGLLTFNGLLRRELEKK